MLKALSRGYTRWSLALRLHNSCACACSFSTCYRHVFLLSTSKQSLSSALIRETQPRNESRTLLLWSEYDALSNACHFNDSERVPVPDLELLDGTAHTMIYPQSFRSPCKGSIAHWILCDAISTYGMKALSAKYMCICDYAFAQVHPGLYHLPSASLHLSLNHLTSSIGNVPVREFFAYIQLLSSVSAQIASLDLVEQCLGQFPDVAGGSPQKKYMCARAYALKHLLCNASTTSTSFGDKFAILLCAIHASKVLAGICFRCPAAEYIYTNYDNDLSRMCMCTHARTMHDINGRRSVHSHWMSYSRALRQ